MTHTPKTAEDCKLKNARGTRPKEQPAQKSESSKATLEKQSRQTDEPVVPKIKWNQDSIELNVKVHRLPITKEYMLKEYSDVFKDATSGYWHIVLDLASSLLTMFNTPWGKYRWLRLPFGFKIASDVFQERLDRVLRLLKGVHGIADDILTCGETEIQHDGRLLICGTNWM